MCICGIGNVLVANCAVTEAGEIGGNEEVEREEAEVAGKAA